MPSLNFKGKALVQNCHLLVPYHELKPVKSKSVTEKVSLHDNLVVHGDNLKALKSLLPYYHGKVKCIYMDPPYNTGNEAWVYNDAVNSPMMKDWLGKVVDREDLTRHDKWLCMMMPRLKLLREFLTEDGVIFVSIDDNEVHWLRGLLDEIFGEENFVATIIWEKVYSPKSSARFFSENHDYIVIYARRKESFEVGLLPRTKEANARYENPDMDKRGPWKPGDLSARNPYSIVMDAFAGSATTAQAVLEANKEDNASRRFLLIEGEDYADALTAERLRRVIKGIPKAKEEALQKGLGGSFSFIEVGNPMGLGSLLKGDKLPSFTDLAGYVFYTATGEEFDPRAMNKKTGFIGTSVRYDVYLFYEADLDYLKNTALTLDLARGLPKGSGKRRLVFAPTKYLDSIHLEENRIDFCQLPFEIYKAVKPKKA